MCVHALFWIQGETKSHTTSWYQLFRSILFSSIPTRWSQTDYSINTSGITIYDFLQYSLLYIDRSIRYNQRYSYPIQHWRHHTDSPAHTADWESTRPEGWWEQRPDCEFLRAGCAWIKIQWVEGSFVDTVHDASFIWNSWNIIDRLHVHVHMDVLQIHDHFLITIETLTFGHCKHFIWKKSSSNRRDSMRPTQTCPLVSRGCLILKKLHLHLTCFTMPTLISAQALATSDFRIAFQWDHSNLITVCCLTKRLLAITILKYNFFISEFDSSGLQCLKNWIWTGSIHPTPLNCASPTCSTFELGSDLPNIACQAWHLQLSPTPAGQISESEVEGGPGRGSRGGLGHGNFDIQHQGSSLLT